MATKAAEKTAEPKTLPELRSFEGLLYVKNNSHKFWAIRHRVGDQRVDVELASAGQPDSIAILPKLALELRGFQRAWMRGELTVSTNPDIEDEITLLMNQHVKASDEKIAEFMSTAAPSNISRELLTKPCLYCGVTNNQGVIERGRVTQSAADAKQGIPPLCDEHVDMSHLYVPTLGKDAEGNDAWTFTKVETK